VQLAVELCVTSSGFVPDVVDAAVTVTVLLNVFAAMSAFEIALFR
jgi:hypothetical protein